MDDFLAKPITMAALQAVLQRWLKAGAETPPAPPASDQFVDVPQLTALLEELLPLLAQNKFDALGRFKALQACVAQTAVAAEIDEAGKPLSDLRFDITLDRLRQLAQAHEWNIGTR